MATLRGRLERLEAAAEEAMLAPYARELAGVLGIPVEVAAAELRRDAVALARDHARHCRGAFGPGFCAPCIRRMAAECGLEPEEIMREAGRVLARIEAGG